MSNILPNAVCLITMTDDELRQELLKDIYNSANLREMIRRLTKLAMDYAKMADCEKEKRIDGYTAMKQIYSITVDAMIGLEK